MNRMVMVLWGILQATAAQAGPVKISLPTDNDLLFSSDPSGFYMYTDRMFEGVRSKPRSAGRYGYVRNQKRTELGIVFTRFHEGIDIAPVKRDRSGRALDEVRSIGDGRVVHTSHEAGRSSYGRYVVIEHDWGDGPLYSLYGHLEQIHVKAGEKAPRGHPIGRMGCTGWGGNRNVERSHLHLELNLAIHDRFPEWHDRHYRDPNHHGIFNGLNLIGLDIAGIYLRLREDPGLTVPGFVAREEPYFRVAVPRKGSDLQLADRYPWLWKGGGGEQGASLEITLSRSGIPLGIEASARRVSGPVVTWVRNSSQFHSYATRGWLTGVGNRAGLTDSGIAYVNLLTGRF